MYISGATYLYLISLNKNIQITCFIGAFYILLLKTNITLKKKMITSYCIQKLLSTEINVMLCICVVRVVGNILFNTLQDEPHYVIMYI